MVAEPKLVIEARKYLGTKEIVGPKHNAVVVQFWRDLGRPYRDDETAWCGGFVGAMAKHCGYAIPSYPERAASWATWGAASQPRLGAVGVKPRVGGNHVFIIVGITADGRYYKALGGNQSNMVSIVDIPVSETKHIRWPTEDHSAPIQLPILRRGTLGASEA